MKYPFVNVETGETVHIDQPMGQATLIGDTIVHDGQTLRRLPTQSLDDTGPSRAVYPRVSRSLPRHLPGFEHNERGQVVIKSAQEAKEAGAAVGKVLE